MRVVEWDVTESPTGPTGHLVSMKLRALTPDGIRIAIAKEYGLSNYREVKRQEWCVITCLLILSLPICLTLPCETLQLLSLQSLLEEHYCQLL